MDIKKVQPLSFGQVIVTAPAIEKYGKRAQNLANKLREQTGNNIADKYGIDVVVTTYPKKRLLRTKDYLSVFLQKKENNNVSDSFFKDGFPGYILYAPKLTFPILDYMESQYKKLQSLVKIDKEISKNEALKNDKIWLNNPELRHMVYLEGYSYDSENKCAYKTTEENGNMITSVHKYFDETKSITHTYEKYKHPHIMIEAFETGMNTDGGKIVNRKEYNKDGVLIFESHKVSPAEGRREQSEWYCYYNDKGVLIRTTGRSSDAWYDQEYEDIYDSETGKRIDGHYNWW